MIEFHTWFFLNVRTRSCNNSIIKKEYSLRPKSIKQTPLDIYLDKHITKHKSLSDIKKTGDDFLYFYIFSQNNSEFGVFGITNSPYRRIGEYLRCESDTINFSKSLKTQLWYGPRRTIINLETNLLHKIRCYKKYDHLLVNSKIKKKQLEFFPSLYRKDIENLVNNLIVV